MALTLLQRSQRLRISARELGRLAGLSDEAVAGVLKQTRDTRQSTVDAIERALKHEELNLLDSLLSSYPLKQFPADEHPPPGTPAAA